VIDLLRNNIIPAALSLLPESARRSLELPGLNLVWRGPYENQFAGTSVSVVMLVADR
jgi:hypothetical protein